MKILVLGGDGMLGHQMLKVIGARHDVRVTLRQELSAYADSGLFSSENAYAGIDLRVADQILTVISAFHPDAVVNAAGLVKQRASATNIVANIEVNALLPHRMALICRTTGSRFIHLSTDCVFSGTGGNYSEDDRPDPVDIYGHSKLLGEVVSEGAITLRKSTIGLSLNGKTSLIDWFLNQTEAVQGYSNAIYSGITSKELARVVEMLLVSYPSASGLYHLSSAPISKYELLLRLRDNLGLHIGINRDVAFCCDRSLDSTRFRDAFSYTPPSWPEMIDDLASDIRQRQ